MASRTNVFLWEKKTRWHVKIYAFLLQFIRRQLSRHQFRHFHENAEFGPSGYGVILGAFHLLYALVMLNAPMIGCAFGLELSKFGSTRSSIM